MTAATVAIRFSSNGFRGYASQVWSGGYVVGAAVDGEVDVHADRAATLLGQLSEQSGRPSEEGEPAQQLDRQAEVGEGGAAYPRAVEREPAAEHLLVDPADRLEQAQVRPAQPLLLGDPQQDRRTRVLDLVDRVAETGDEPPGLARPGHGGQGQRVPPGVVGREVALDVDDHGVQELAAVLRHPEEPRAAAEQTRGQRSLQRVRGREVGQPGRDRRRREPVVGERDEHRLEDPDLRRRRPPQGHQPEGQLAEPDLAHEVGREVLAEQPDLVGVGGAERGRQPQRFGHGETPSDSQRRISAPCSSRVGGGSR